MEVTTDFTENAQHDYELVQEALTKNSNRAFTKLLNRYVCCLIFEGFIYKSLVTVEANTI